MIIHESFAVSRAEQRVKNRDMAKKKIFIFYSQKR